MAADKKNAHLAPIHAVYLEWQDDGRVEATGTDRYRLATGAYKGTEAGVAGTALITRTDVERVIKGLPKSPARGTDCNVTTVTRTADGWLLIESPYAGVSFRFSLVDAEFPKWRSLIPFDAEANATGDPEPVEQMAWNPEYMADVVKIPHEKNTPVRCRFTRKDRPMLLDWNGSECNGIVWRYMLMPVRLTQ
ncbi:MAG: hypothetical protein ACYCZR_12395 [Burkholderiales bacterium]